jgi:hypothetical protein
VKPASLRKPPPPLPYYKSGSGVSFKILPARSLAPLVKTRDFGMTALKQETKLSIYMQISAS